VFYAFDLLWLDGEDMRGLPLIEGKRRLRRLIRAGQTDACLMPITSNAEEWSYSGQSASAIAKALWRRASSETSDLVQNP
jgi:ATP-dependent DNA ligase